MSSKSQGAEQFVTEQQKILELLGNVLFLNVSQNSPSTGSNLDIHKVATSLAPKPETQHVCPKCDLRIQNAADASETSIGVFHNNCFRCSRCTRSLFREPYETFDGILYCEQDFHRLKNKNRSRSHSLSSHSADSGDEWTTPRLERNATREVAQAICQIIQMSPDPARVPESAELGPTGHRLKKDRSVRRSAPAATDNFDSFMRTTRENAEREEDDWAEYDVDPHKTWGLASASQGRSSVRKSKSSTSNSRSPIDDARTFFEPKYNKRDSDRHSDRRSSHDDRNPREERRSPREDQQREESGTSRSRYRSSEHKELGEGKSSSRKSTDSGRRESSRSSTKSEHLSPKTDVRASSSGSPKPSDRRDSRSPKPESGSPRESRTSNVENSTAETKSSPLESGTSKSRSSSKIESSKLHRRGSRSSKPEEPIDEDPGLLRPPTASIPFTYSQVFSPEAVTRFEEELGLNVGDRHSMIARVTDDNWKTIMNLPPSSP